MKNTAPANAPEILLLDNHLLAVNKPSGLPSQPDASGDASLIDWGKEYLRREFAKPGQVYLALLHRLDRPTSGAILMARTEKAAGRMADAFRRRDVEKRYLALVECRADPGDGGTLRGFLVPAANGSMREFPQPRADAREARLSYRTLAAAGGRAVLEIDLETGVKHQIRCQLARAGLPVVGDFRYGAFGETARPEAVAEGRAILLHARRVRFLHPVRREAATVIAPLPAHWDAFMQDFAGAIPLETNAPATSSESGAS